VSTAATTAQRAAMAMPTCGGGQRGHVALRSAQQLRGRFDQSCESTATSKRRLPPGEFRLNRRRPGRVRAEVNDPLPSPLVAKAKFEAAATRRQLLAADRPLARDRSDVGGSKALFEPPGNATGLPIINGRHGVPPSGGGCGRGVPTAS
jgi:hypothetical protein